MRIILRLSLYQLLFLDTIPDRAAVDQAVRLTRWAGHEAFTSLVNGVLRTILRGGLEVEFPDREGAPDRYLAAFYSYPIWLVRRWLDRYGLERSEKLLEAGNARPNLIVRVNTLRAGTDSLVGMLEEEEGIQCTVSPHCSISIALRYRGDLRNLSPFRQGLFTVQDTSSTLVGMIPSVEAGRSSLDLCAAPGGKCTHLAERGRDRGMVVAVDSGLRRMRLLRENADRLGLSSILCVVADGIGFGGGQFDLVLVDAPCTGSGVLSRRADLRWRLKEEDLRSLPLLQSALLVNASTLVKNGGELLYSTCSLEPEENMTVVKDFLGANADFSMREPAHVGAEFVGAAGCFETFPDRHVMDGMFACLMVKRRG